MKKNEEVKAMIEDAVTKLFEELKQGKSDRLINYLKFCSRFHKYSWNNQILIQFQMPEASHVAGYRAWQNLGYQVKKGAKSIKILAPGYYTFIIVNGKTIFYDDMTDAQKRDIQNHRKGIYFFPISVFDISQCENISGEETPQFFTPLGNTHEAQYYNLKKIIENNGIEVIECNTGAPEGISYGGRIEIKETLDFNNKTLTLCHEYAHEVLDQGPESDRDKTTRNIRECRAEAVSFIVGQYLGLDNPFTADYLLSWGNNIEEVKANLEAINKAANRIISEIEESLNMKSNDDTEVA